MLLYLLSIQSVALSMTHLMTSRHLAAALTGVFVTCMALVSGYVVHFEDVGEWASWLKYVSPQWWLGHPIHQVLFPLKIYLHVRFHSPILKYDVIWTGKNRAKIAIITIKNDMSLSAFKQRN